MDPYHVEVEGQIWLKSFDPENLRSAIKIKPELHDIFIVTYPKSGTTWLQHITLQLIKGDDYKINEGFLFNYSPFIEYFGSSVVSKCEPPRVLKSHLQANNIPWSDNAKYIFCVRNPKDVLVSFFHHYKNIILHDFDDTFDNFFEMFISDRVMYGSYFDHLLGYYELFNKTNFLCLKYEDMLKDLPGAISKIASHLGLVVTPEKLKMIVANSTFESMKKIGSFLMPEEIQKTPGQFIRKGEKGGWRNYFSKEQNERLDKVIQEKFKGTDMATWWQEDMAW